MAEAAIGMAIPDRIAIDAKGYGWRVWDDEPMWSMVPTNPMWSMVPTNPDNSPIPQPVTWFVPALSRKDAEVRAAATAMTVNGYERLMELVGPENRREAIACLLACVRAVVGDFCEED